MPTQTRLGFITQAYFPVSVRGMDGEFPLFRELFRADTGAVIGLLPTPGPVLTHQQVFEGFEQALALSELDRRGLLSHESLPYAGRLAIREYCLNAVSVELCPGETIAMTLRVTHSYDPVLWPRLDVNTFEVALLGTQWPTLTPLVTGQGTRLTVAGDEAFPVEHLSERLRKAVPLFEQHVARWQVWQQQSVTAKQVAPVFELPALASAQDELWTLWAKASASQPRTVWLLWTVLMDWAAYGSLVPDQTANKAAVALAREKRVFRVMESDPVQALLGPRS